jgi:hypothetical protein
MRRRRRPHPATAMAPPGHGPPRSTLVRPQRRRSTSSLSSSSRKGRGPPGSRRCLRVPWEERGRPHRAQGAAVLLGDRAGPALLGDQIGALPWSCPRVEEAILTKTLISWI